MDWERLRSTTKALLLTLTRFGSPVDAESLLIHANESDPNWRDQPGSLLYAYRALDLLGILQLSWKPDGSNHQITEAGIAAINAASMDPWLPNKEDPRLAVWAETEDLTAAAQNASRIGENTFLRLELSNWRQFKAINIAFHPRLTIITGANGAGKTTLLNILAPHLSWSAQLVSSSPDRSRLDLTHLADQVGQLFYANGARTPIIESVGQGVHVSSLQMPSQQAVPGLYISSHRSISSYQPLQNLPARFSAANVLLGQFAGEVQTRYLGGSSQYSPLFRMKEALVAAAMHGYGNRAVVANEEARHIWEGFQIVLGSFLPASLKFQELRIRDGDVLFITESAEFALEAVSGGLSAMLELAWQIFLRSRDSVAFTVCIDEPENHLHPELQRTIVPALLNAFPSVTFVIATHSPFVVTAWPDSNIYALASDTSGVVTSRLVRDINASGTSDDTLMSVLGLDTPLPLWAEKELSQALAALSPNPTVAELREFRDRLIAAGLRDQFPAAIEVLNVKSTGN